MAVYHWAPPHASHTCFEEQTRLAPGNYVTSLPISSVIWDSSFFTYSPTFVFSGLKKQIREEVQSQWVELYLIVVLTFVSPIVWIVAKYCINCFALCCDQTCDKMQLKGVWPLAEEYSVVGGRHGARSRGSRSYCLKSESREQKGSRARQPRLSSDPGDFLQWGSTL